MSIHHSLPLLLSLALLSAACPSETPDPGPGKGTPQDMAEDLDRADASANTTTVDAGHDLSRTEDTPADLRDPIDMPADMVLDMPANQDMRADMADMPTPGLFLAVAASARHSCALHRDGTVYCWGNGGFGRLGQGDVEDIGDDPGELPAAVELGAPAIDIQLGTDHSCALLQGGAVKCWGSGAAIGQGDRESHLGDEPGEMPPPDVNLGGKALQLTTAHRHSCALMESGAVKCWGAGTFGKLGNGSFDGIGDDPGEMPPPDVDLGTETITRVDVGIDHSCALDSLGQLRCWGFGTSLGQGTADNLGDAPGEMPPPTVNLGGAADTFEAAGFFTCARMNTNQQLRCFGSSFNGELGGGDTETIGDAPGEMPPPILALGTDYKVRSLSGSYGSACAILDDDSLRCWGLGMAGKLGSGANDNLGDNPGEMPPPAVDLQTLRPLDIAVGYYHSCLLLDDDSVRCFGRAANGRLANHDPDANLGDEPGEMPPPAITFP